MINSVQNYVYVVILPDLSMQDNSTIPTNDNNLSDNIDYIKSISL